MPPDYPVSVATHLDLMVLVLEGVTPILLGSQVKKKKATSLIPNLLFSSKVF